MNITHLLSTTTGHKAPVEHSIWNYYYKKNSAGEHMREPHSHDSIEIECIVEGRLILEFEQENLALSKNDIVVIKPNVMHKFRVPGTCKTCKRVNIAVLCSALNDSEISTFFFKTLQSCSHDYLLLEQNSIIQELMSHIVRELSRHQWGYNTIVQAELTSLMVLLLRSIRKSSNSSQLSYAQQAKELMDSAPAENWTPASLSKQLNISASYLMHIFHAEYSITLMKYLESKRLDIAKKLLSDTQNSIYSISADIGFSTLQHFSYVFKKNVGISPTQYRKISQEIIYKTVELADSD